MLGEYDIVRPVHGFYPSPHLQFARPCSSITYNPLNFLAIYAGCTAAITDRVHVGVAALSFGNLARIASLDTRYAMFERAPVIRDGDFLRIDPEGLEREYKSIMSWLAETFSPLVRSY